MKKYIQILGIWFLIIPLAIINGGVREKILIKLGNIALPLSGFILSSCNNYTYISNISIKNKIKKREIKNMNN